MYRRGERLLAGAVGYAATAASAAVQMASDNGEKARKQAAFTLEARSVSAGAYTLPLFSATCAIGGAFWVWCRGRLEAVREYPGVSRVCFRVRMAQVELRSGQV